MASKCAVCGVNDVYRISTCGKCLGKSIYKPVTTEPTYQKRVMWEVREMETTPPTRVWTEEEAAAARDYWDRG